MVASMDEHWVAARVVLTDATWAVCSVDVMGVPSAGAKDAWSAGHWAESLAAARVVTTAFVSVDPRVAMWVVVTDASRAGQ